ncbi:hypothetical protein VPHD526_0009 [Vibrio phage D526]
MGSKSSSSTSSTNSTVDNTFNNVDNRVGGDGGIIGGNVNLNASESKIGNVAITNTDYGAVQGGLSAALAALENGSQSLDSSLDFAGDVFGDSVDLIGQSTAESLDFVTDSNKLANQQTLQAIDRSFALAGEASRSEAAGALQDFMKWSAIVLLGGGGIYLVAKKFL